MIVPITWHYCRGGDDITANAHAHLDADEVRAGRQDDICLLAPRRTPDNAGGQITGGDLTAHPPADTADEVFPDADTALTCLGRRTDRTYVTAGPAATGSAQARTDRSDADLVRALSIRDAARLLLNADLP